MSAWRVIPGQITRGQAAQTACLTHPTLIILPNLYTAFYRKGREGSQGKRGERHFATRRKLAKQRLAYLQSPLLGWPVTLFKPLNSLANPCVLAAKVFFDSINREGIRVMYDRSSIELINQSTRTRRICIRANPARVGAAVPVCLERQRRSRKRSQVHRATGRGDAAGAYCTAMGSASITPWAYRSRPCWRLRLCCLAGRAMCRGLHTMSAWRWRLSRSVRRHRVFLAKGRRLTQNWRVRSDSTLGRGACAKSRPSARQLRRSGCRPLWS